MKPTRLDMAKRLRTIARAWDEGADTVTAAACSRNGEIVLGAFSATASFDTLGVLRASAAESRSDAQFLREVAEDLEARRD